MLCSPFTGRRECMSRELTDQCALRLRCRIALLTTFIVVILLLFNTFLVSSLTSVIVVILFYLIYYCFNTDVCHCGDSLLFLYFIVSLLTSVIVVILFLLNLLLFHYWRLSLWWFSSYLICYYHKYFVITCTFSSLAACIRHICFMLQDGCIAQVSFCPDRDDVLAFATTYVYFSIPYGPLVIAFQFVKADNYSQFDNY